MKAAIRPLEPGFLAENAAGWTQRWVSRREANASAAFAWPQHEGSYVNVLLREHLRDMTAGHCAYCDAFELGAAPRETIDHFRPKSAYPTLAYTWSNLFPCCDVCQTAKSERFVEALLKPDDADYSFERYFVYDVRTGELTPNPAAPTGDRDRASESIRIFDLNSAPRCSSRKRARNLVARYPSWREDLNALPYRFVLEL